MQQVLVGLIQFKFEYYIIFLKLKTKIYLQVADNNTSAASVEDILTLLRVTTEVHGLTSGSSRSRGVCVFYRETVNIISTFGC